VTVQGAHVHVVRRLNANGAWAKSVRQRWVPADGLVVRAYDQYVMERLALPKATSAISSWSTCSAGG
jgi:integrase/recombinase XerD